MSTAHALASGRRAAEARMTDTCRITKPGTGAPVFNEDTGQYDPPPRITVYEGPCRIPARSITVTDSSGVEVWRIGEFPLDLPVTGSENVAVGHVIEYLTAPHDSSLPGRVFGVVAPDRQSQSIARRLRVKETVG